MANLQIKDARNLNRFFKASGAGTDADPFVFEIKQSSTSELPGIGATNETAPTTDTAASGLNGRLQRIAQRLTSLIALLPSSIGQKAKADSLSVTLASDQGTLSVAESFRSLTYANGTVSNSGDNTIIFSPGAGQQTYISVLQIQNESATGTTILIKFGSSTKWRKLLVAQGSELSLVFPTGRAWQVGNNTALVLNLSAANAIGYSIAYYTDVAS